MTESIRPAKNLIVLAGDIVAARAKELLYVYDHGSSVQFTAAKHALEDAVRMYTDARIDSEPLATEGTES